MALSVRNSQVFLAWVSLPESTAESRSPQAVKVDTTIRPEKANGSILKIVFFIVVGSLSFLRSEIYQEKIIMFNALFQSL